MNTPINFEASKLLKEKGFDKSTEANWWILAKDHSKNIPIEERKIFFAKDSYELELKTQIDEETEHNVYHVLSAPIISDVVMWLYEKHEIWIYPILILENRKFVINIDKIEPKFQWQLELFDSPTKAYEAAIEHTLKNLI